MTISNCKVAMVNYGILGYENYAGLYVDAASTSTKVGQWI
jgi:hypothetical protein